MMALAARRELGGGVRQHPGSTTALRGRVNLYGAHVSRVRGGADALRQQTDPLEPAGRRFANFFLVLL
jgi:hypothetical protein